MSRSFSELLRSVREHIGQDHRYAHSVRVARSAELLAQRHGADPRRARLAGLLHDLARLYSPQQLIEECERRGLGISPAEREHPVLLHAKLGAALARERFGVDDEAVLSAIEKHTTGSGEMSALDCVVYLADTLEPQRTFEQRAALWELSMRDLDEGMRATLQLAMEHSARKRVAPAPETLAAARRFGTPASSHLLLEAQASAS